jgi:hypothetical protein
VSASIRLERTEEGRVWDFIFFGERFHLRLSFFFKNKFNRRWKSRLFKVKACLNLLVEVLV